MEVFFGCARYTDINLIFSLKLQPNLGQKKVYGQQKHILNRLASLWPKMYNMNMFKYNIHKLYK